MYEQDGFLEVLSMVGLLFWVGFRRFVGFDAFFVSLSFSMLGMKQSVIWAVAALEFCEAILLIERDRPAPMHACTPGQVSRTKRSATLQLLSVKSGVLVVHSLLCARVHCVYEATMSALTGRVIRRKVGACDSVISWIEKLRLTGSSGKCNVRGMQ